MNPNLMSRSDYESLYPCQTYPKRTSAAVSELVTRGLKASEAVLDYLVNKGVVSLTCENGQPRQWHRRHIDKAASYLAEQEAFTPEGWRCVLEYSNLGQDAWAFREACEVFPLLPPDPGYFVRTVHPGIPGRNMFATVSYRAMSEAEEADFQRKLRREVA